MATVRRERGLYFEDFEVGRRFDHHWGRTLTAQDGIAFSTVTMNFNPLYFDAEYARRLGHEDVVINPLLVYAVVLGLSVEDLSEAGGPFLGLDDLCFPAEAHPGDTIRARSVVLDRRTSKSRPGWGVVEWRTTGYDQRGRVVCEYRRRNLSRLRHHEESR
ncbi:acyl dehydratase [Thermocatellispora tengchongensis]|uniref:Acyl dehydratase n=1 Tax=Thermocatellispora tengchongensis TaxID=1073253 RepID=A0A840PW60_9ACTN|nr:MaoC family dehydratase [Thermocatellispora tengchongensis]MBB5140115.1 acyl dehydratase [Thermocatellispora tengchongensis]